MAELLKIKAIIGEPEDEVRYYGHGQFCISKPDTMRTPDLVLKSAAFIGQVEHEDATTGQIHGELHATGFFVSLPSKVKDRRFYHFVTAKHVAQELQGKDSYIITNKNGGGVTTAVQIAAKTWFTHPDDPSVDVAILPVNIVPEMDVYPIPSEQFVTNDVMGKHKIGIGDEIFTAGLFTMAPGEKENMPIIRHGNIAMIPRDKIQTGLGYADVYLVEARSIGGLSGSPVFVRQTIAVHIDAEGFSPRFLYGLGGIFFLGLMHGHWDIKEADLNNPHWKHDRKTGVNLGIGIVVPATKILEIIDQPVLKALRDEWDQEQLTKLKDQGQTPGMD